MEVQHGKECEERDMKRKDDRNTCCNGKYADDFYKYGRKGRSRRKRGFVIGGKQAAALCLGTAILGGAVGGICQSRIQQNMAYLGQEDSLTVTTAWRDFSEEAADMAGQVSMEGTAEMVWQGVSDETVEITETAQQGALAEGAEAAAFQTVSTTVSQEAVGGMDVSNIAAVALPSVVSITNTSVQEVLRFYDRFGRNGLGPGILKETTSCGSGVIIAETDEAFYMVTNYHVVEGAVTLSVGFVDGAVYQAELCGTDSGLDLAVIKVARSALSSDTLSQITVVSIGDSNNLKVGEQVVAIGNALGYGQSVTTGIVSALNRVISSDTDSSSYIQTDAAINPGNSGGALLNMDGELIGINTAKTASTDVEGMGYAIPISHVWETIRNLMTQTA